MENKQRKIIPLKKAQEIKKRKHLIESLMKRTSTCVVPRGYNMGTLNTPFLFIYMFD